MKIKSKRKIIYHTHYTLVFNYLDAPKELEGCGFSFYCDKDGNVDKVEVALLHPAALENYNQCLTGQVVLEVGVKWDIDWEASKVSISNHEGETRYIRVPGTGEKVTLKVNREVISHQNREIIPAVGECECGKDVELHGFTNTCECGADYNMSGQLLAPRSQWGEETGESLSDILKIP